MGYASTSHQYSRDCRSRHHTAIDDYSEKDDANNTDSNFGPAEDKLDLAVAADAEKLDG